MSWLSPVLRRARPENEEKERKTASGRTFKVQGSWDDCWLLLGVSEYKVQVAITIGPQIVNFQSHSCWHPHVFRYRKMEFQVHMKQILDQIISPFVPFIQAGIYTRLHSNHKIATINSTPCSGIFTEKNKWIPTCAPMSFASVVPLSLLSSGLSVFRFALTPLDVLLRISKQHGESYDFISQFDIFNRYSMQTELKWF